MATTAVLDLRNFTPNIIKDQELWGDFLDVVSDELDLLRLEIEKKKRWFQTNLYTDETELINLGKSLGYTPNLLLDDSIQFIRSEIDSIVFKIKNKATYAYYNYLFKLIPREGEVFTLFQDYLNLCRAFDFPSTIASLLIHDIATPFVGAVSILHYDTYIDEPVLLDAVPYFELDADILWFLDQDIIIKPTQHLVIEYPIDQLVQNAIAEDVLITADYLAYLGVGVEYGRKVTNFPHVGINLSIPMGKTGFCNEQSVAENTTQGTSAFQYTIPLLKTYGVVTDAYRLIENAVPIEDPPVITILNPIEDTFVHLAVGTGTKEFFRIDNQPLMTDLDVHISFEDNANTTTFKDNYDAALEANVIAGTHTVGDGISGKTIIWNGTDTEVEVAGLTLDDDDREWTIWVDAIAQLDTDPKFVFSNGYFDLYYDTTAEEITCIVTGGTAPATVSFAMTPATLIAGEFMISIEFIQGATVKLYIDGVEKDSASVAGIGTFTLAAGSIFLGCDNVSGSFYTGKLDEFRIYSKALDSADRLNLFNRKLGTMNYLANEVYRKEISSNQIVGNINYEIGVGTIPANTINEEILAAGDDVTEVFTGTLNQIGLLPGHLDIAWYSIPDDHTVSANKKGQLIGTHGVGTIDFETGEYSLTTRKAYPILHEVAGTGIITNLIYTTANLNVVTNSLSVHYTISTIEYTAIDDGVGGITGTGITAGTIDYDTGDIDITFSPTATDAGTDTWIEYEYDLIAIPATGSNVTAEYTLANNLEITEVALLNADGVATVYANIPKAEYASFVNHTGFQFFVEQ